MWFSGRYVKGTPQHATPYVGNRYGESCLNEADIFLTATPNAQKLEWCSYPKHAEGDVDAFPRFTNRTGIHCRAVNSNWGRHQINRDPGIYDQFRPWAVLYC